MAKRGVQPENDNWTAAVGVAPRKSKRWSPAAIGLAVALVLYLGFCIVGLGPKQPVLIQSCIWASALWDLGRSNLY